MHDPTPSAYSGATVSDTLATDPQAGGQANPPSPDSLVLERFRLIDRVADAGGTSFWRAQDERLRRAVGIRFMDLDNPLVDDLRDAAVEASLVTDRRAVPVLDIAEDAEHGHLVIVTEWLVATPFGQLLTDRAGEPLEPSEAARVALEVARFLASTEAAGIAHSHVRPNAVMITDGGEVRVRGLGIDRVLFGVEPDVDPGRADVHGAGAVLYAGLTGRWPGPADVPELPLAPLDRGRAPWPSRVVVDVPADLDRIAARCLVTATPPKGQPAFTQIDEVIEALTTALAAPPLAEPVGRDRGRLALRVTSVLLGAAAAVGLAALGISLIQGMGGTPLTSARPRPAAASSLAPSASASVAGAEREIPIVTVRDFDPYGDTREENPKQAANAIDGNPSTAWKTVRYKSADLSGKPGVGLLIDLGAPRPVAVVDLRLVGNGTDVSLRATDDPTLAPEKFRSMAEVTGAGDTLVLRVPSPVTTRYLLVWLTQLPWEDGAYQGGVSDVRVRG